MQRLYKQIGALVLALGLAVPAMGTTIDFDELADGTVVTNQYAGLTFTNATAITAGFSLNEFEFPPRSASNVAFEDGVGLVIDFAMPVSSVYGYFTYLAPLTLSFIAVDSLEVLMPVTSAFVANLALSGDFGSLPNERLGASSVAGISRMVITGDPAGGSFTLDDLTFERAPPVNGVPEPGTLLLVAAGVVGLARGRVRPGG